jgi:hypothetical protein
MNFHGTPRLHVHEHLLVGKPVVACEHDFASLDLERYKVYDSIYSPAFHSWELYHQPMLEEDRKHFAEITELCKAYVPISVA